ncbi:MAG: tRNA pseudouridine(38-40) synthase TruA [Acidobacteria bacterium]|nr:tRNA pseudouridine(38-40) synthase TruA [Acidobacteriota bacterium]
MKRENSKEKKILLHLSFTGTNFRGFQYQNRGRTVQRDLENALKKIDFVPKVVGCSRTDGGVHARDYIAHTLDKHPERTLKEIVKGLNSNLAPDILIKSATRVNENFHARFSTISKTYRYFIYLGDSVSPPVEPFITKHPQKIDLELIKQAIPSFLGRRDFRVFTTSEGRKAGTHREIASFSIFYKNPIVCFEIKGKSFLHRMVRFIIGSVVAFGRNKIDKNFLDSALNGKVDFLPFPVMAAKGLHLWDLETEHFDILDKYESSSPLPLWPFETIEFDEEYRL